MHLYLYKAFHGKKYGNLSPNAANALGRQKPLRSATFDKLVKNQKTGFLSV